MSQTQLASMFIGKPYILDELQGESKDINNLFILDKQDDRVLSHINKRYVIFNEHEQDLPTYRDTFRFTVLGDKPYAEYLTGRNGLIVPGDDGELLEFRLYEVHKYRDLEGLKVDGYALATYLDLKNARIIEPHTTSAESAEWHARQALAGVEWQVGQVDFKGVRSITFNNYTNPYDYLKRIAREFDLELRFYIKTDGSKVTGRYVDLIERVGEWRGRTVEFGRDLQGIRRIEQTDNVVTALLGVGPEREDGTRLEVFVEDKDALERWGRNGRHIVDVYEPISERADMTIEELEQYTRTELNKRINAVVSYEADILDLENVPGLENKKIRFGDTIRIKDLKFNPALYLEARVFNQKRDVFNKANKTVQLGDYIEYTEDEVKAIWNQLRQQIRDKISEAQLIEYTYSKEEIDTKDIQIKTSVEEYAQTITEESKQEVIVYVDETIEPIEVQINGIAEDVAEAYSQISQAFDEIELKVSADEVINAINISSESIKISADRIEFEGHVFGQGASFAGHLEGASGTFKGSLEGATGTFSGRLTTQDLYIEPPDREPNLTSLNIFRMAFNPTSHAGYFKLRQSPTNPDELELYTTDQYGIYAGGASLNLGSVVTDAIFTRDLSVNGNATLSGKITNDVVEFNSGPSMDMTGGSARWRQSTSNYIIQNTAGSVAIVADGQQRHVFSATGTKTGGTIIVDGKNLGMSPIDSPQILIEYIEFNVPLSKEGTKVYIDKTYLKTIEEYAVFTNNGQIIEKGEDYIIVSGEGTADIRFVGERIGYKDTFFADMSVDEEEGTDEVDEEKKSD